MKKTVLLLSLVVLTAMFMPVAAKNVKVEAMSDFSTVNPPLSWRLKVAEEFTSENGVLIEPGCIFEGNITEVKEPQRLKKDASFVFVPMKFYDIKGQSYTIENGVVGKYSSLSDLNVGSVAKTGAVAIGDKLLKGFGPGIALVEGMVKNTEGNRMKSGVVSVYESTPLSYYNKGHDVFIPKGKIFIMSFKSHTEETEVPAAPNYEYETTAN